MYIYVCTVREEEAKKKKSAMERWVVNPAIVVKTLSLVEIGGVTVVWKLCVSPVGGTAEANSGF